MNRGRSVLVAAAFGLLGVPIAYGLLTEAALARQETILRAIGDAAGEGAHPGVTERFRRPEQILRNYRLEKTGSTVEGRIVDHYELRPRQRHRLSYRLHVRREDWRLERFQVAGPDGKIVFEGRSPLPARPMRLPIQREAASGEQLRGLNFVAWLPSRLPAGFELQSMEAFRVEIPVLRMPVDGLFACYSDGMASIILVEFSRNNAFWRGLRKAVRVLDSGTEGVARRVSRPEGSGINVVLEGTEIFAGGHIPGDELEAMIRSLQKSN